jgi:hypothetical protein
MSDFYLDEYGRPHFEYDHHARYDDYHRNVDNWRVEQQHYEPRYEHHWDHVQSCHTWH